MSIQSIYFSCVKLLFNEASHKYKLDIIWTEEVHFRFLYYDEQNTIIGNTLLGYI